MHFLQQGLAVCIYLAGLVVRTEFGITSMNLNEMTYNDNDNYKKNLGNFQYS